MSEEIKNSEVEESNNEPQETQGSHEYDGIEELNNPAPYWIMAVFFVTIGFSMLYAIHNFGYPGNKKDQNSIYEKSLADYDEKQRIKKSLETGEPIQMNQEQILAIGATLYSEKGCAACHASDGGGNAIGPNLTDNYWINGCSEEDIVSVIRDGRAAKGMTPYKNMMTAEQIKHLSIYIKLAMIGSEPANPKDPQGEECE